MSYARPQKWFLKRRKPAKPKLSSFVPATWGAELRQSQRTSVTKWGLHAGLLAVLLGVPYAHGHWRGRSLQAKYATAAACMYGATPSRSYATASVDDAASAYATMFLEPSAGWPRHCEGALRDLAKDPALFLFPSVKQAEANVQKAAQIVLSEIEALPQPLLVGAKIPVRPLWALEMLQSAIAEDAEAAGLARADAAPQSPASAPRRKLPTPSLLNIDSAPTAPVKVWGRGDVLQTAAFDARSVSYIRLGPHEMTRARLPRSGALRSVVIGESSEYLVWMTPHDKCGIGYCAGRSTGLSMMPVPLTKIPAPLWIAAHPFGSPSRSLAWQGTRMWMAAAKLDGAAKLVEFSYALNPNPTDNAVPPPLDPQTKAIDDARDLTVFTDSAGELGALALVADAAGRWRLVLYRDSGAKTLVTLPQGWTAGWVRQCSAANSGGGDTHYFVIGNDSQTLIGYTRDAATKTWPVLSARLASPRPAANTDDRAAALACSGTSGITIAFTDDDGALMSLVCTQGAAGCVTQRLAEFAQAMDVTYTAQGALVAYSARSEQPQVQLRSLDLQGTPTAEPVAPAPCWESWGGLCGAPAFAWVGGRLVLAARSGSDLMAVESPDAGKTWFELSSTRLVKPPGPQVMVRRFGS